MINCALFEPDIPQNAGAILRLGACLGVTVHVVHPAGFALTDRHLKRAGLDYLSRADLVEHADWPAFTAWLRGTGADRSGPDGPRRLIALSAHGTTALPDFAFRPDDVILLGRESAGLPAARLADADAVIRIPMRGGNRSLNVACAASIALFEALRQTGGLPAATGATAPP